MRKTSEKKVRKVPASLLKISSLGSSVSVCADESPGFSVSGASTLNGLFQTIIGLKKISELLLTALLTILNFLLTIKFSYFLFFTYVKSSRSTMTWKKNLPQINKFFSFSFPSTSPGIRMLKWVHVWRQLDNEISTWFPKLHRIQRTCEFLPMIYQCSTKYIDFRLQTSLIYKKEKKNII